jgi:hypothetical protein
VPGGSIVSAAKSPRVDPQSGTEWFAGSTSARTSASSEEPTESISFNFLTAAGEGTQVGSEGVKASLGRENSIECLLHAEDVGPYSKAPASAIAAADPQVCMS